MSLSIEERYYRLRDTTHVVRPEDMTIYRLHDIKCIDNDLIFVEVEDGLWFQDLDVMTLEECANAETALQWIKDKIIAE